ARLAPRPSGSCRKAGLLVGSGFLDLLGSLIDGLGGFVHGVFDGVHTVFHRLTGRLGGVLDGFAGGLGALDSGVGGGLGGLRGLGSGGFGGGGGLVGSLFGLLRAGTQGQAQGQGEQGLVQGHGSFPRLELEFRSGCVRRAGTYAGKIMSRSRSQSSARLKSAPGGTHAGTQASSIATAVASPPPMHRAATPRLPPWRCRAWIRVTTSRAPEAPIGCPRAQAPPCTVSLSCGMPRACMGAMATQAKASLTSNRSTSPTFQPALASTASMAATGAVVNHSGAWEWVAWATTVASGVLPAAFADASDISTRAAAPSLIEEELAAVMLPSFLKAGRRAGIFSMLQRPGCSSVSYTTSPLRPATVTGTISALKAPSATACWARRTDSAAKASCCSRLKPNFSTHSSPNTPMACLS